LTLHAPSVPSHLTEMYHGDVSEMPGDEPEYLDGTNPYELRMLLQNATLGEPEAVFEEVILLMEQGMDIDTGDSREEQQTSQSCNTYKYFQRKLNKRSVIGNPLGFRSVADSHQMESLHNVYLFIRKYDLSAAAGEETYVPVYYTCLLYMSIIHVHYTCVLYEFNIHML
jgi:hypothetical protein